MHYRILTNVLKPEKPKTLTPEQLIPGCSKQERFAQGQLYALLAPKMFVVCLRYSRTREEAEECLQEGFLRVFTCIDQFKNSGAFEGWIRKIMVNCALQKYRNKPILYAIPHSDIMETDTMSPEEITSILSAKELIKIIQLLSPAYRMVFNLYVFEGMKHKEIAEVLGITEGTSKSNLSDARRILQKMVTNNISSANPNISYL